MTILTHTSLTAPGKTPTKWLLFLHGIFGSGANWRGIAQRILERQPTWGAVLVDLRMHGRSQGFDPPHTVSSAARDLDSLTLSLPGRVAGVVGHSFGGKVALQYSSTHADEFDIAWILDSNPGQRKTRDGSDQTMHVLSALEQLGPHYVSRKEFQDRLIERGFSEALVAWLAMNVQQIGPSYGLRLDLVAIRAMLEDYVAQDLWSQIEHPSGTITRHVVVAANSTAFDDKDRKRLRLAAEAHPNRVRHYVIADAGHWVHVDAPGTIVNLIAGSLAE